MCCFRVLGACGCKSVVDMKVGDHVVTTEVETA